MVVVVDAGSCKVDVTANALAEVFNQEFAVADNTQLITGASEPFYVPANMASEFSCGEPIHQSTYHRVFSRSDYAASVLHEAAHWCIAGSQRRERLDYGYWYEPDGRSVSQQLEFEKVEVKPQALERILCEAAGIPFRVSVDNANSPNIKPSESFVNAIYAQTIRYLNEGLPDRASRLAAGLSRRFGTYPRYLSIESYNQAG